VNRWIFMSRSDGKDRPRITRMYANVDGEIDPTRPKSGFLFKRASVLLDCIRVNLRYSRATDLFRLSALVLFGMILGAATHAADASTTRQATPVPKLQLYVLPAAFSAESQKSYAAWIKRLTDDGLGNAIWQEIEEVFYDHPRYTVLQSPVTHEEFLKILAARQTAPAAGADGAMLAYELPDKVVTVNTNIFTRPNAKLVWGKSERREEFHVTVYLRYYDLMSGKLNTAIPAQADAIGPNPIIASRQATRAAVGRLLGRLGDAVNQHPVR
jgi:hypothetical protein